MSDTPEAKGSDYLSELIKSVTSAPPSQQESNSQPYQDQEKAAASRPPDIFSSLLSNPELLSKLPAILSTVGPLLEALEKNGGGAIPASATPQKEEGKNEPQNDRRAALLCAMKPYLCHDRQMAIDYIIKLSRLGDILKTL